MKKIIIYPNPKKEHTRDISTKILRRLKTLGTEVFIPHEAAPIFEDSSGASVVSMETALANGELIIIIGGDGSILRMAKTAAIAEIPILGVNMGNLGFLSEIEPSQIPLIDHVIEGNYTIDYRMMLDVCVRKNNVRTVNTLSLNEVIVARGEISHTINVEVCSNDLPVVYYSGDGVIFCTPTGSTAYSLSAGGPIVEPMAENIIITPLCPHSLHARSIIMAPNRVMSARICHLFGKSAYMLVDGNEKIRLYENEMVYVCKSKLKTKLIRVNGRNFNDIINQKFSTESFD